MVRTIFARRLLAAAGVVALGLFGAVSAQITITDINPDQSSLDASDADGASGGRVNGAAFMPGNPNVYFAATEFGGLYKTNDFLTAGGQWFRLESHLPMLTMDIEAAPDGAALYASSRYDGRINPVSGINVSRDGGATWTRPASATAPAGFCNDNDAITQPSGLGIAVDPEKPAAVYVGTDCGLAISSDYGVSWTYSNPVAPAAAITVWDVVVQDGGLIDVCGLMGSARSIDSGVSWQPVGNLPMGRCSIAVSPHEEDVLFATVGARVYESDDGGATWTNMGTPDVRRQGRVPFVETNNRGGQDFDLWYGDVRLYRAGCTSSPAAGGLRCPMANLDLTTTPPPPQPAGWAGPYTRGVGGHDDVGGMLFNPAGDGVDDCPVLFHSDGGVYYNTDTNEANCHVPAWEQPAVTPHALWLWAMDGSNPAGVANLDLYMGMQDNGSFATADGGALSPTWINRECCDIFDASAAPATILYTRCCFSNPGNQLVRRGQNMAGGGPIPFPTSYPATGKLPGFINPDIIDRFGPTSYVLLTRDCTVLPASDPNFDPDCPGADGGVYVTTNATVDPVGWTELGNATEPPSNSSCAVKSSQAPGGGNPVFYVQAADCSGNGAGQLWRFDGTNPAGVWQRVDTNLPSGGIGVFDVDPNNPNRLYASNNRTVGGPRMVFSNDGGQTWQDDVNLDLALSDNGQFKLRTRRTTSLREYSQPSLIAFDPSDANMIVAGGVNSGVLVSADAGASWLRVTDPYTPDITGIPHIPRPLYAYFDHQPADRTDIYIGTRGKGAMRIGFRPPPTNYQYAAKFVCGDQPDAAELRLTRGRYATTINIHNPNASDVVFQKRLSLSYPPEEQRGGLVRPFSWDRLTEDQALKTDCGEVRDRLFDGAFPQDYIEGFITLRSESPLDVTGVYTTADLNPSTGAILHSSIDIEQIVERDMRVDLAVDKSAQVFSFPINDVFSLHYILYTVDVQNISSSAAHNVKIADTLTRQGTNTIAALAFFQSPIVLPPGGSVIGTTPGYDTATIDLAMGDIAGGASATAQFIAVAIIYQFGFPGNADLVDKAFVSSAEGDASPLNNTAEIITTVVP